MYDIQKSSETISTEMKGTRDETVKEKKEMEEELRQAQCNSTGLLMFIVRAVLQCYRMKEVKIEWKYGVRPRAEDLRKRGRGCSICLSEYKQPMMLHCTHIFCAQCISRWFQEKKTCPECRADILTRRGHSLEGRHNQCPL